MFKLSPFLLMLFVFGCSPSMSFPPASKSEIYLEELDFYAKHSSLTQLYEKAVISVVLLTSTDQKDYGAGVIIDSEGYILTNRHIANNSKKWWVSFYNIDEQTGIKKSSVKSLKASVVRTNKVSDLALLKLESNTIFTPMELGKATDLKVGQRVFSISHPKKQNFSLFVGIISRLINEYEWMYSSKEKFFLKKNESHKASVIQVQMPENDGNSGGPIIDNKGMLVGISTTMLKNGESLSYAIRIDEIIEFLNEVEF